ncbi:MAG: hypothetical protein KDJ72_06005 [Methyloceanibacter sp.]|uniref:hypothetical protein n=1 Tax=Methyloceanibacter sp. TaxID=1965321 RepID=UPI001DF6ABA8|nr:hypothetical protein [Methyloceanibacter sp.]MCB1442559.1 hypothetical protein [Methyloceanibacter sp.]MCC0059468.1 hypothetical protein [Hyphomicrobiaceae bacterium]
MARIGVLALIASLGTALALVASAPATHAAVSDAVRNACEKKANKVTPPLRAGEREAYITNCIADAATAQGKAKKKKY